MSRRAAGGRHLDRSPLEAPRLGLRATAGALSIVHCCLRRCIRRGGMRQRAAVATSVQWRATMRRRAGRSREVPHASSTTGRRAKRALVRRRVSARSAQLNSSDAARARRRERTAGGAFGCRTASPRRDSRRVRCRRARRRRRRRGVPIKCGGGRAQGWLSCRVVTRHARDVGSDHRGAEVPRVFASPPLAASALSLGGRVPLSEGRRRRMCQWASAAHV